MTVVVVLALATCATTACDEKPTEPFTAAAVTRASQPPPALSTVIGSPDGRPVQSPLAPTASAPPSLLDDLAQTRQEARPPQQDGTEAVRSAAAATKAAQTATPPPCTRRDHLLEVPVQLSPAPAAVTARWYSHSGPALRGYEVALVSEDLISGTQPAPVWHSITAPVGCQWLEVTFADLTPGRRYQVWLHARLTSPAGVYTGEEWSMVGRSGTVAVG